MQFPIGIKEHQWENLKKKLEWLGTEEEFLEALVSATRELRDKKNQDRKDN